MATRRSVFNTNQSLRKLEDLEAALKIVLDLEAAYGCGDDGDAVNSSEAVVDPFANPVTLSLHADTPNSIKALLGGGTSSAGSMSNSQQQKQQQEQEQQNYDDVPKRAPGQGVRAKWLELDQSLARLASLPQSKAEHNTSRPEWEQLQKIITDVNAGRPDKWIRSATMQERDTQRKAFMESQQEDVERKKDTAASSSSSSSASPSVVMTRSVVPHDIVLGSAASTVGRSILHAILTSVGEA